MSSLRTFGVVLAGGMGTRIGTERPKQLLEISGKTVLERSVAAISHERIDEVIVVMAPGFVAEAESLLSSYGVTVIEGGVGAPRSESTVRALALIAGRLQGDDGYVLLHDAARPLLSRAVVDRCIDALETHDAVTAAIASSDTILEVAADGTLHDVPDRTLLRRVQTPQGFRVSVLQRAHELAAKDPDFQPTDDCSVVLRYLPEVEIAVVEGDERNIKVTHPIDIAIAETLLA